MKLSIFISMAKNKFKQRNSEYAASNLVAEQGQTPSLTLFSACGREGDPAQRRSGESTEAALPLMPL